MGLGTSDLVHLLIVGSLGQRSMSFDFLYGNSGQTFQIND